MKNGKWKMKNEKWKMENGKSKIQYYLQSMLPKNDTKCNCFPYKKKRLRITANSCNALVFI